MGNLCIYEDTTLEWAKTLPGLVEEGDRPGVSGQTQILTLISPFSAMTLGKCLKFYKT